MMLRRSALDKAGGIDAGLPGGDDFDLSIRLRKAGYRLLVDRTVFVYHHGFTTGNKVHGDYTIKGGWNSFEFKSEVDTALIQKHGFKEWWNTIKGAYELKIKTNFSDEDKEGNIIRSFLSKDQKILDIACGNSKTVDYAVGIDMIAYDNSINTLAGAPKSKADVQGDVSQPLQFEDEAFDVVIARHILEHMIDPVEAIQNWSKVLKKSGLLIIAVPNHAINNTVPMNLEHVHVFVPNALTNLVKVLGFRVREVIDTKNGISFILIAEKI